jgi:pimeloyl-ACP methyl ester carboxylesterase
MFWLVLSLASLLALAGLFVMAMNMGFQPRRIHPEGDPGEYGLEWREARIETAGSNVLDGWLLPAARNETCAPILVILHGWGSNRFHMLELGAPLAGRMGYNVLLYDALNHGSSPTAGVSSLPQFARDALAAIKWCRAQGLEGPIALVGLSIGGAAALLAASWPGGREEVKAVVSIASFAHPLWLMRRYLHHDNPLLWPLRLLEPLVMSYTQWRIGHRFDDIAPMRAFCALQCPAMLIHGARDKTCPVSDMRAIMASCPDKKAEILLLPKAGHRARKALKANIRRLEKFLRLHLEKQ